MRGERMPAKIITLSQKDQDLLRVALNRASDAHVLDSCDEYHAADLRQRIKDLKERLV